MTDTPPPGEQFLDSRWLVAGGGVVAAVLVLMCAGLLRLRPAIDDAAWDRVAAALADTPASSRLVVVRAAARTGDAQIAAAVLRLDSLGAARVALALDLSVAVPPSGGMAQLPTRAPTTVFAATLSGDTVGWPWFLPESARSALRREGRLGVAFLLRDADGVVRRSSTRDSAAPSFAALLADAMAPASRRHRTADTRLLRFADVATPWHGLRSLTLPAVLTAPAESLRQQLDGATVVVGIDDGTRVPTSVGALPQLAIVAHDVNAQLRVLSGDTRPIHAASGVRVWTWWLTWIVLAALVSARASWRLMLGLSVTGVVVQAAAVLWLVEADGTWMPLGSTVLAWLSAVAGAAAVAGWQVRRAQRFTSRLFSQFVTPALADAAWRARHLYLDGGRPAPMLVPVTVLFLDLRGFTRFSESTDPASVMSLLTEVTAACAAGIAAHGGLVDDFAGDGIKADFGVPVPRTSATAIADDARHAVRCALELSTTLKRLLPRSLGTGGTQVRIGIHSGRAVAGTIGGVSRLKYTVAGDVVNVAARLQSLDLDSDGTAPAGCRILLSAATMALLGADAPAVQDEGAVVLKGREHPVSVFRIVSDSSPLSDEAQRVRSFPT